MKRRWFLLLCVPASTAATFLAACGDDDNTVTTRPEAGADVSQPDTSVPDSAAPDTGTDAAAMLVPTVAAAFSAAQFELAEGLAVHQGLPLVGFAPQGRLAKILPDGGQATFAAFASPADTFTLGLAVDGQNAVYVAVAASGASPVPPPGVYKVDPDGGTPAPFSSADAGTFAFPNGLDFVGTDLYVSDSATGKILKVAPDGSTTEWVANVELMGDVAACNSPNGFPIGVNGIAHDDAFVYGVNLDKGSFFRIARQTDGGAGAVEVLYKNCDFFGADGIVRDADGTFLVANNPKSRIDRVTITGTTAAFTTVAMGPPLDGPASLAIEGAGATRRLWITNSAFASASAPDASAANPALLSAPLP